MDYNLEWKFLEYDVQSMINRSRFLGAIQESVMIAEGTNTVSNMVTLNEAVSDKVKGFIAKIIAGISRIWGKFTEVMTGLVKRDTPYLQKYKDIILKKAFKQDYQFTMYNRVKGVDAILNTPVPIFNYASLKDKLESEDAFLDYFPKLKAVKGTLKDGNITFKELCNIAFRGSEDEMNIPAKTLNMTDMYNYCIAYNANIKKTIEADSKNLQAAAKDAEAKVQQLQRESKNESTDLFGEDSYKSLLFENFYLTEAVDIKAGTPTSPTTNTSGDAKDTKDPGKAYSSTSGEAKGITDEVKNLEEGLKKVQLYVKLVGEIMTSKMSSAENAYKDYMQIIRAHVKDHVGGKDTTNDKAPDSATVQGKDSSTVDNTKLDTSKLP